VSARASMRTSKEMRDLIWKLKQQGWMVERTPGGHHLWLIPPDPNQPRILTGEKPYGGDFHSMVCRVRRAGARV
jgi:hypothetical protein